MSTGSGAVRVIDNKLPTPEVRATGVLLLMLVKRQLGFVNVAPSCALCDHWHRKPHPSVSSEGYCTAVPGLSFSSQDVSVCKKFRIKAGIEQGVRLNEAEERLVAEFRVAAEMGSISEDSVAAILTLVQQKYPDQLVNLTNQINNQGSSSDHNQNQTEETSQNVGGNEAQATDNGAAADGRGTA